MKIDLLITAGGAQVILTPSDASPSDKAVLDALRELTVVEIKTGPAWAKNIGGYYRQFDERPVNSSTMIVLSRLEENHD